MTKKAFLLIQIFLISSLITQTTHQLERELNFDPSMDLVSTPLTLKEQLSQTACKCWTTYKPPSQNSGCRSCPSKCFREVAGTKKYKCTRCSKGCKSCSSLTRCSKCEYGYYETGGLCRRCHDLHCRTCTDNGSRCYSCISGYFKSPTTKICLKCLEKCMICQNTYSCQFCDIGYVYNQQDKKCQSTNVPGAIFGAMIVILLLYILLPCLCIIGIGCLIYKCIQNKEQANVAMMTAAQNMPTYGNPPPAQQQPSFNAGPNYYVPPTNPQGFPAPGVPPNQQFNGPAPIQQHHINQGFAPPQPQQNIQQNQNQNPNYPANANYPSVPNQ